MALALPALVASTAPAAVTVKLGTRLATAKAGADGRWMVRLPGIAIFSADHGAGYGSSNMVFGKDGYLYISADSYTKNSWDSTDSIRKVLRIDVSKTRRRPDVNHPQGQPLP